MFVVAGVTGKVGQVVANELLAKKQLVKVIVRDANKGAEWSKKGAEVAVGSLEDANFLTVALKNAKGFFTLLPPNYAAPDFYAYQRKVADNIAQAVKANNVPHVVILSSVGADLDQGNGPIKGLNYLEKALKATNTTLTAVRAGYFQENFLNALDAAKQLGIFANFTASADHPFPMIATKDIGRTAAEALLNKPSKHEVIDLHGPAYTTKQIVEKLGNALGKTLNLINVPEAQHVEAMSKAGFPKQIAEVFAEMYKGFNTGIIRPIGDRLVQGTTTIDETIKSFLGDAKPAQQNVVGWFEIPVNDIARSQTFYGHVFNTSFQLVEMGGAKLAMFPMSPNAGGAAGALVQSQGYEPSAKGTVVYFNVADIEQTLNRVKEKGGKVLQPKMSIGEHGFIAHFEDTEGNRVAVHCAT